MVFINSNPNRFPDVLCYRIYDRLMGLPSPDWNTRLLTTVAKVNEEEEQQREVVAARRDEALPPSYPLPA
ncbi:MAG: hypothetical protein ACOX8W_12685 [bacterium]